MKTLALLLFALGISQAATFTCTSTSSGNVSNAGIWSGCNGGIPDNGRNGGADVYLVVVAAGNTVTVDTNVSWGSNGSALGHAFTINGTSGNQGVLQVASGVTLTLAGDQVSGCQATAVAMAGLVTQYGIFQPLPGSTVSVNAGTEGTGCILVQGTILADAAGLSPINFTVPTANYSWTNVQGSTASGVPFGSTSALSNWTYSPILGTHLQTWALAKPMISNAAGTGLGSCGNTSLVISHTAGDTMSEICVPVPTANPATWDIFAISKALAGHPSSYVVDYINGTVYANIVSLSTAFNYSYDYLTTGHGPSIILGPGQSHNSGIFRNCIFTYWGTSVANLPNGGAIFFAGQFFGTGSSTTTRTAEITNCQFLYTARAISLQESGASADSSHPILFSNNLFYGYDTLLYPLVQLLSVGDGVSSYYHVQVNNNAFITPQTVFNFRGGGNGSTGILASDVEVNNNFIRADGITLVGTYNPFVACQDCQFKNNQVQGLQRATGYGVSGVSGVSGHPTVISGNVVYGVERCFAVYTYNNITNNACYDAGHHSIILGSGGGTTYYLANVNASNNLAIGTNYNIGPSFNFGYNGFEWIDNVAYYHNTILNRSASGAVNGSINLGDSDSGISITVSHGSVRDNLVASLGGFPGSSAIGRTATTSSVAIHLGIDTMQNNSLGYGDQAYEGTVNRGAVITKSAAPYNTSLTRNVLGTSLWNPTYSTNQTTGALKFIYTDSSHMTLSWSINSGTNYGTAQQLIWPSGGTVYTVATSTPDVTPATLSETVSYTITVSGTPWTTAPNVPSTCPTGHFVLFLTGAAAGQTAALVNTTANNTIVLVPPHIFGTAWTFTPAATDTFVIIQSEVTLPDAATGTINAGIDPRSLPLSAGTYTDTGINITMTDTNNVDPRFLSPVNTNLFGQYAPTNPALCTVASDGTTIGAVPCQPVLMRKK